MPVSISPGKSLGGFWDRKMLLQKGPLARMAVTLSPFRTQRLYLSSKIDGVDFSLWVFFFLVSVF